MNSPEFSIISGGPGSPAHPLSEWNRVLNETNVSITMHAATRPEPDADVVAEATPGKVRTLCLAAPMTDHQRAAMRRDAGAAAEFNAYAETFWKRRREAAK